MENWIVTTYAKNGAELSRRIVRGYPAASRMMNQALDRDLTRTVHRASAKRPDPVPAGPYVRGVMTAMAWGCESELAIWDAMARLTDHLERPGTRGLRTAIIKRAMAALNL